MATKKKSSSSDVTVKGKVSGETTLAHQVVETIAGVAAREVDGVYQLGKGAIGQALGKVTGTAETTRGVYAEVGKKEVALDLDMVIVYGFSITDVVNKVRGKVGERVTQMTGLTVKEVNVNIVDIHYSTTKPVAPARVE